MCGSFAKATRSSRVKSGCRSNSSLDFQFFIAGVCSESSTTDDLKRSHKVFVAAIRHLSLVLVLSPDINRCITPHPKREVLEDPNHDGQQRKLFNDVDAVGLDTTLGIVPKEGQLCIYRRRSA